MLRLRKLHLKRQPQRPLRSPRKNLLPAKSRPQMQKIPRLPKMPP
jgi:hypothetical protein